MATKELIRTVSSKISQEDCMAKLAQEAARVRVFGIQAKDREVHEDPEHPGRWIGTFKYTDTGLGI
jgi:hypothetical protein